MTKKALNQNAKYVQDLIDDVEPDFVFNFRPINRFSTIKKNDENFENDKINKLANLKKRINSIVKGYNSN